MFVKKLTSLRKKKEIEQVFLSNKSAQSKVINIRFLKNKNSLFRLCIIVSKKVNRKSTTRNKIRRQIRSVINNEIDKLKPGLDLVIITHPPIISADYKRIESQTKGLLRKLNLYQ